MKARGSTVPSFDTIVGAKGNSALPHYRAGEMKVANNNVLLIGSARRTRAITRT